MKRCPTLLQRVGHLLRFSHPKKKPFSGRKYRSEMRADCSNSCAVAVPFSRRRAKSSSMSSVDFSPGAAGSRRTRLRMSPHSKVEPMKPLTASAVRGRRGSSHVGSAGAAHSASPARVSVACAVMSHWCVSVLRDSTVTVNRGWVDLSCLFSPFACLHFCM